MYCGSTLSLYISVSSWSWALIILYEAYNRKTLLNATEPHYIKPY